MVYWLTHLSDWLRWFYFHTVCLLKFFWSLRTFPNLWLHNPRLQLQFLFKKCSITLSVSSHPPYPNIPPWTHTTSLIFTGALPASWEIAAHSLNYPLAKILTFFCCNHHPHPTLKKISPSEQVHTCILSLFLSCHNCRQTNDNNGKTAIGINDDAP